MFANLGELSEEERFDLIAKSPNCRIDRIVSAGHSSPKGFLAVLYRRFHSMRNRMRSYYSLRSSGHKSERSD